MNLIIYKIIKHKKRYIFLLLSLVVIQILFFLSLGYIGKTKERLFHDTVYNIDNSYTLDVLYQDEISTDASLKEFQFIEETLDLIRAIDHVKYAISKSPHVYKKIHKSMLSSSGGVKSIFYTETGKDIEKFLGLKLLKGSPFSKYKSEIKEALITKSLADSLGIFNKELPLTITVNGINKKNKKPFKCTVTGIIEDIYYKCSEKDVYPLFCKTKSGHGYEHANSVLMRLDENVDIDELENKIATLMQAFTKTRPIVQVISQDVLVNELWNEEKRMYLTMLSIIPLVLFYTFFAIFGLFWNEMSKDKIKYGILRAIGFNRVQVILLVFKEAVLLSVVGFMFTCFIILNLRPLIQKSFSSNASIASLLFISFLVILVFVVLAACIPALKITSIQPVEALSEE